MEKNSSLAYSEVFEILNLIEPEYANKVPENVKEFFEEEREKEYKPVIDMDKPLENQNLQTRTFSLLALLYLSYWCETSEEKQELLNELDENEARIINEQKKYDIDEIFKKNKEKNIVNENVAIIEYKEKNIFTKLWEKIKSLFKKQRK